MSANEKSVVTNEDQKAKRHRSPGFPVISIDDAISRVRVIFQHDKRAFTTADAILTHLNYKAGAKRSGAAGRTIAALKQYGLLDEKSGRFRVSDLAFRILHLEEDSDERKKLIREAALSPPIFKKILAYYDGDLPSDAALRSHLILNEKFNPDSVEHFIRVLRETIDVANPLPEDYTTGEESEGAEQPPVGGKPLSQPPAQQQTFRSPNRDEMARMGASKLEAQLHALGMSPGQGAFNAPLAVGEKDLKVNISGDSQARIIFNGQVTQEAIELLAAMLEIQKRTFPKEADLPKEPTRAELMQARGTGEIPLEPHSLLDEGLTE